MKTLCHLAFRALLVLSMTVSVYADIIILNTPSFVQPEENLLLKGTELITTGMMVQGITNQTDTIFNIYGNEPLTLPAQGQARIEATDGYYIEAKFEAADPDIYFTLFEANVNVAGTPWITVNAIETDNSSTTYQYAGDRNGQNFFGVKATGGSLIDFITISTAPNEWIEDIRQVRIGGIGDINESQTLANAPEPTSLLLLGTGLGVIGLAAWRRRKV